MYTSSSPCIITLPTFFYVIVVVIVVVVVVHLAAIRCLCLLRCIEVRKEDLLCAGASSRYRKPVVCLTTVDSSIPTGVVTIVRSSLKFVKARYII